MKQTQTCLKPIFFFKWLPVGGCACKHLQSYSRFIISTLRKSCPPVSDNSFLWHKRKSNPVVSFLLFYLQLSNICKNVAITEHAGLQSFCFSLMMEEHPCTYWIAHKALKGFPTKILSPCEGS